MISSILTYCKTHMYIQYIHVYILCTYTYTHILGMFDFSKPNRSFRTFKRMPEDKKNNQRGKPLEKPLGKRQKDEKVSPKRSGRRSTTKKKRQTPFPQASGARERMQRMQQYQHQMALVEDWPLAYLADTKDMNQCMKECSKP